MGVIVEHKKVFNCRRTEKLHSAIAVETGIVSNICSNLNTSLKRLLLPLKSFITSTSYLFIHVNSFPYTSSTNQESSSTVSTTSLCSVGFGVLHFNFNELCYAQVLQEQTIMLAISY